MAWTAQVVALLLGIQTPASGSTLTMEQAADLAVRNAFAVRIAESNVEKSRQQVAASRGNLGPRVNVGANYVRFDREISSTFSIPGGPTISNVVQPLDSKTASANVTLPIDISGNIRRIVRASQASLRATEATLDATRNDVRRDARRAYLTVLRAKAVVEVQEAAVKSAEERLRTAKQRDAVGDIDPIEVRRLETQLRSSEVDLIGARNAVVLARMALNNVLGIEPEVPLELVDLTELPPVVEPVDDLVKTARKARPEVRALTKTREALANIRRAQEAGNNPSLALSVNYQRNLDPVGGARRDSGNATLAFSFPVFDSGVTRANVRAARQDEAQAAIQLEQVLLGVSLEVRAALANLATARERLGAAESQRDTAREGLRLAGVRRDAGVGTFLEIVDAQTQVTAAETAVVTARYDYLLAYAELQRALGTGVEGEKR